MMEQARDSPTPSGGSLLRASGHGELALTPEAVGDGEGNWKGSSETARGWR